MKNLFCRIFAVLLILFVFGFAILPAKAQSRRQQPPQTGEGKKNKRPDPNAPKDERSPEDKAAIEDKEVLTIKTELVNVDATVYNKKSGQIVTGLAKENFAIFVDGQKKEITNFSTPESPITVAVVVEFSRLSSYLGRAVGGGFDPGKFEVIRPAAVFLQRFIRPPDDYASLIAFDIRPTPITDFTNDPKRINDAVNLLLRNNPAFSENNLYDAVKFALVGGKADSVVLENSKERTMEYGGMADVKAKRRAVILITSGIDTFSKINYDQIRKIIQQSGVPIYIIGTGNYFYKMYEPYLPPTDSIDGRPGRLTFLQADNVLKTFAKESGGMYIPVTFESEVPSALNSFNALLRNQYSLAFEPNAPAGDTKKHKIEVKVDVNKSGNFDDKNFIVQHRPFYISKTTAKNDK
jgi:Ca-activated chloride channel family protein